LLLLAVVENDGVVMSEEFILDLNLSGEYAWEQRKYGSDQGRKMFSQVLVCCVVILGLSEKHRTAR
jgi:hypothetical protein